jgi:N-acetylmuramoyl-L-alanine amidase
MAVLAFLVPSQPTTFTPSLSSGAQSVFSPVAPTSSIPVQSASPGNSYVLAGTPDYSGATWVPANPANYSSADRPHDDPVQMIVIHDTELTAFSAVQRFQDPSSAVSAHYIVSQTGQVTQMVAEKDIAWHAGNWDYNTRAIGIEHEGYAWTPGTYTAAEYQASAQLAASICSRWGVPMDRQHVIGHDEVPDPNDPGKFGGYGHRTDPGPYWNWSLYMSLAQSYANALPSPPRLMPDPVVVSSGSSATITWQPASTCHLPTSGYTVIGQPGNLLRSLPPTATSVTFNHLQTGVNFTFTVTASNADGHDTLTAQWRCDLATLTKVYPTPPQLSGTGVTFTARASGCPYPLYQFLTQAPGSDSWQIAQAYSTNPTFRWNTIGLPAGTYLYTVWTRDMSSTGATCNDPGCFDAYFPATPYRLTTQPCTAVSDSLGPASAWLFRAPFLPHSPPLSGTSVTFTATASGCPHPLYQFLTQAPGSDTWQIAQAYSTNPTFSWNTIGLTEGSYLYTVWARDSGSPGTSCSSTGCDDVDFPATAYSLTTQPRTAGGDLLYL